MKYKYKLNNLDCVNCANKIESRLNEDNNINSANINFSKLTVTIETQMKNGVKEYISKIIKNIDSNVNVLEIDENVNKKDKLKFDISRLIVGIIFSVIAMFILDGFISKILIVISYIILLFRTINNAIKLLLKSKTINENLLVTISCIGAYFTNNISEGLMVIILYEIGKILESIAVNNSRKSISELMDIKPEYANLKKEKDYEKVYPEEVKIGDIIVIKQGEKIPLDGIVVKGRAKLNVSALTGESKLKEVSVKDKVLSGSINTSGIIELEVTNIYTDSTVAKILELVETATDRKAKTETFVAKAAKIYTPTVLILAILAALILPLFNISFSESIYRALVFLVISCPCAIAISVPLSYFSGIGKASKEGILIKGSDYLDVLGNINKIIFDKTGTLTTGKFSDYKLKILDNNYTEKEIIKLYVKGEKLSNHPIAKSIINIFNIRVNTSNIKNYQEIPGKGISYELKDNKIKIGSSTFCKSKEKSSDIYLSVDDNIIAQLSLIDGIKKDAKRTIMNLKKDGIITKMFTGDDKIIALEISKKLGIDEVKYELLPEDKYNLLTSEINNKTKTAFVGDGINDAPSLALADIGISMGGVGSASAIEASDVVIMTDELNKIYDGIKLSKYTNKIIKQNLIFAIGIKILVLILSILGIASMWQAVFADTGVTLLTILNTTRILNKKL
ncbi:MAG: cadmium-translocating P-type ATPase [Firmicutes bacterium]|nr:cadmium-translocating P-type ATPase [Bacillota bacterium]